ncbi:hypothetical protein B0A49_07673 [Cryomyces minteri]|uniref:Major facilitator superfamily (MFS) profile domain-containing protein n=1 Tax=Cryomyces minteri TaxID=331657 RepID=A0A4V5NCS7_9PEZI|nr:hypothetical protein B0A49_07673 [Cryomyces minteri]
MHVNNILSGAGRFTWGTEMTYCTPYLLQLGLTKSRTSLVWIAGPLSGLIMQPVVGVIADKSKSKWGRRRPFMVVGTLIVSACLLVLGWTKEIVGMFVTDTDTKRTATVVLAVLSIYAVDFAINAVQSSCRSLIVDTLPIPKQQLGSAWASRMISIGHLVGYGAGALDLQRVFGSALGDSQFKRMTVIAALALVVAVGVTCWAVEERVLLSDGKEDGDDSGAFAVLSKILETTMHLPNRIQAICWVQFWSWIGWFPFLFYSTTWVGEIYLRYDASPESREHHDTLGNIGRVGSMSLVVFSIITFIGSFMLPWIVMAPEDEKPGFTPRPPPMLAPIVEKFNKIKPTLLTAWTVSHLIFAGSMVFAPFVSSLRSATTVVAICGIPWALASWAPFTYIGIEINKIGSSPGSPPSRNGPFYRRLSNASFEVEHDPAVLRPHHNSEDIAASTGELAGIYLGILNLFTTLPQFIGTFISMIVFSILEPGKSPELAKEAHPDEHHSTDGPNAIAVCLFIGALASVGAAYATSRLKDMP